LTGSAGSISILKKIQNDIVLVKKKNKSQLVATGFYWVNPLSQPGHGLCNFFINPAQFHPRVGRVPDRPVGPGRVSKHWLEHSSC
jgi:hypothetical protein